MFNHTAAIGADIGKHSLKIAVVNIEGGIVAEESYPLQQKQSKNYIIEKILDAICEIRAAVASKEINPICIGLSAKGFVDHKHGIIIGPDQGIKDWKNVPLAKILYQETGLPSYIGNDANMMTIAEHRYGAAKGFDNMIFVALRMGIGGGFIINGKLYRGVNNAGGEVGQMIIKCNNDLIDNEVKGSFEYLASASAVVRRYYEEVGVEDEKKRVLTCKEIFELSYSNVSAAVKVVQENSKLVGVGLANLISIFAPEIIVVGGGMSEAADSYFDMVKKSTFENSLENCRTDVRIERAYLGSAGSLLGSAFYGMTRLAGKSI